VRIASSGNKETGKGKNRTKDRHRKPKGEVRIHFKELGKKTLKLRGVRDPHRDKLKPRGVKR